MSLPPSVSGVSWKMMRMTRLFLLLLWLLLMLHDDTANAFLLSNSEGGNTLPNHPSLIGIQIRLSLKETLSSDNDHNNNNINNDIVPSSSTTTTTGGATDSSVAAAEQQRQEWMDRSIAYYSTIMRAERRRNIGQIDPAEWDSTEYQETLLCLAQKHYFALRKIKSGQFRHAEVIYRKIIQELVKEEEDDPHCDHAKLAVTTLLLALHLQRMGDMKQTRSVFLHFFRVVVIDSSNNQSGSNNESNTTAKAGTTHTECACSAKVLGAYALFEMKRGNKLKSLEIAQKAVEFDHTLEPVLQWKQFREVSWLRARSHHHHHHHRHHQDNRRMISTPGLLPAATARSTTPDETYHESIEKI